MTRLVGTYIFFSVRLAKSQSRWPLSGQLAISLRLLVSAKGGRNHRRRRSAARTAVNAGRHLTNYGTRPSVLP